MSESAPQSPRFIHPIREFSAAAKPTSELWRTVLGTALAVALILMFGLLAKIGGLALIFGYPNDMDLSEVTSWVARETHSPTSPASSMLTLLAFAGAWPALWLTLRVVHGRSFTTLFAANGKIAWGHFRVGLAISVALGAAAWLPMIFLQDTGALTFHPLSQWPIVLLVFLPLVFVQATAEELMFRGYLLQQFAARSWSIIGWSVLPSFIFALLHPQSAGLWGISWFHVVFGLIMAAVTSRTGNLGAAMGLHFGQNIINLLIFAPSDQIRGISLFVYPHDLDTRPAVFTYIGVMFVGAAIFMGIKDAKFVRQWRAAKRAQSEAS